MTNELLVEIARARGFEHIPKHRSVFRGQRTGFTLDVLRQIAEQLGYERLDLALRCNGTLTWELSDHPRRLPDARA